MFQLKIANPPPKRTTFQMKAFSQQLEKVKDFKEIFNKGKKYKTQTSHIILYFEESNEKMDSISLGVLALKKIVGKKAVCRNKAKRRFKHGILTTLRALPLESGFQIKIVALTNKNTLSCPWPQVLADIEKEFHFINKEIILFKEKNCANR